MSISSWIAERLKSIGLLPRATRECEEPPVSAPGRGADPPVTTSGSAGPGYVSYFSLSANIEASTVFENTSTGNIGIGTTTPSAPLQVKSSGEAIHIEDSMGQGRFGFVEPTESNARIVLYRGGTVCPPPGTPDITILRNFPNWSSSGDNCVRRTLLKVWAPQITSAAPSNDREATLSLVRDLNSTDENSEEFIDVYNNGYAVETQHGIRIQKRSGTTTAQYRDFVFDQYDGTVKNFIAVVRPSRKVGIGNNRATPAKLSVGGESFSATGSVTASGTTVTGTGTIFTQEVDPGDKVTISGQSQIVTAVTSATQLTVASPGFSGSPSGTMTVTNQLLQVNDSSGNAKLFISDQGNVGIGTAGPNSKLEVADSSGIGIRSSYTSATGGIIQIFGNSDGSSVIRGTAYTGTSLLRIQDINGLDVMAFKTGGNVGIGTTSPVVPLDVNGVIQTNLTVRFAGVVSGNYPSLQGSSANQLDIKGGSSGTRFLNNAGTAANAIIQDGGNVGIGTSSPVALLSVGSSSQFQVNTSGLVAEYGGNATVKDGLASILASVDLTGQTSAIASTTLLTPPATGIYRITAYAVIAVAGTSGTLSLSIGYTDDVQAQTTNQFTVPPITGAGNTVVGTAVIRATTAAPIKYSTSLSGTAGSLKYDLWLRVEKLG